MTTAIQSTPTGVRWLYAAVLLGNWLITRSLWWPSFKAGASTGLLVPGAVMACAALVSLWRAVMVVRRPSTLDTPAPLGSIRWLRRIGIVGMGLGVLALLASFALPWILANTRAIPTEALGAVGLIAGLLMLILSASAMVGLTLFEFSRLLAFEQALRDAAPPSPSAAPPAPITPNHVNWRPRSPRSAAPVGTTPENE